MKLNLLLASDDLVAGHINIDPLAQSEDKQRGDVLNLDWVAEDSSCHEIRAVDIIDYVDMAEKANIIQHWVSKLKKGGSITLGGYDIYAVTRAIHKHDIDFQEGSAILFGLPDGPALGKSGILHVSVITDMLKTYGVQVTSKRVDNMRYIVKGVKQ